MISPKYVPRTLRTPGSIVHLEYNPKTLPLPPSPNWTRFVCISDTHSQQFEVPDGDVLLHSGDITNLGALKEFEKVMEWLCSLPHKLKIITAGNHDLTLHEDWYEVEHHRWHRWVGKQERAKIVKLLTGPRAQKAGIVYLQDSTFSFQAKPGGRTWTVYGSPWSPYFHNWAFNYHREDGEALVSKFPATDILLTHGPPAHILDRTQSLDFAGCSDLRNHLPRLRPRLHVFGHIHESRGAHIHEWPGELPDVKVIPDDDSDVEEDEDDDMDDIDVRLEEEDDTQVEPTSLSPVVVEVPGEVKPETVFVNAATSPGGRGTWRGGLRVQPGGPGFQPVVVDLRD